jgi:hopanoid C-3 methylase HpnR
VFRYWHKLGLTYMFLGLEAIDEEGLKLHRKRSTRNVNFQALDIARDIGLTVAINLIADPDWDEKRFEVIRQWAISVPEIVHLTVATPYPGTELWLTESRKLTTLDYRLFDIQHAVLPTRLPLRRFYEELVKTQNVLNRKHLGIAALRATAGIAIRHLMKGQTNFVKMLWKFSSIYNPQRQYEEHMREVKYTMKPPQVLSGERPRAADLFVHMPEKRPRATEKGRGAGAASNPSAVAGLR